MSAPIAKSQFAFQLPNLTYVDASYEEPNLHISIPVEPRRGLVARCMRRLAAFRAWRETREAAAELEAMTDRELQDIGLSRSDLTRVFNPAFNADLVARGTC